MALASGETKFEDDDDVLRIYQDATLYGVDLAPGASVTHKLGTARRAYLVPSQADITVNGQTVTSRAGLAVEDVEKVDITASDQTDVLLFDLP